MSPTSWTSLLSAQRDGASAAISKTVISTSRPAIHWHSPIGSPPWLGCFALFGFMLAAAPALVDQRVSPFGASPEPQHHGHVFASASVPFPPHSRQGVAPLGT